MHMLALEGVVTVMAFTSRRGECASCRLWGSSDVAHAIMTPPLDRFWASVRVRSALYTWERSPLSSRSVLTCWWGFKNVSVKHMM